jgi:LysM repeat protein
MGAQRQISLRILAPAALALFSVLFLVIVFSSLDGDEDSSRPATRRSEPASERRERSSEQDGEARSTRRTYVVEPGDTLAEIAAETGVPIDELLALNPSLDPRSLVTGQRIKLRE